MSTTRVGDVVVVDLGDGDNRMTDEVLSEVNAALDSLEAGDGPRALVTRGGGKVWSNGLDIQFMTDHPEELWRYVADVELLLGRMVALGVPTVAAITGHAFGTGAMLSVCHDVSVMRADRGYWCLPEVDLGLELTPGEHVLLRKRLPQQTYNLAVITGRRFDAAAALDAGIVDETCDEGQVVDRAIEIAADLAPKAAGILGTLKAHMFGYIADALRDDAVKAMEQHRARSES